MNKQHTPGDWKACGEEVCDSSGCTVADCFGENPEANANLIAKTPEMLRCLRELIDADNENDANLMHVIALKMEIILRDIEVAR